MHQYLSTVPTLSGLTNEDYSLFQQRNLNEVYRNKLRLVIHCSDFISRITNRIFLSKQLLSFSSYKKVYVWLRIFQKKDHLFGGLFTNINLYLSEIKNQLCKIKSSAESHLNCIPQTTSFSLSILRCWIDIKNICTANKNR